jgi:hypothetical protein
VGVGSAMLPRPFVLGFLFQKEVTEMEYMEYEEDLDFILDALLDLAIAVGFVLVIWLLV